MNSTSQTVLRLSGEHSAILVVLSAIALGLLMWRLYRREVIGAASSLGSLAALCRSLAVVLVVLTLCAPVLRHETVKRRLGRVIIALDGSASMRMQDAESTSTGSESPTRWQRASDLLLKGERPLLGELAKTHNLELHLLRENGSSRLWWRRDEGRDQSGPMPSSLGEQPDGNLTNLDQPLVEALGAKDAASTIVLISDGQHNGGGSPEQLASSLRESAIPIFTLGMGSEVPPPDLSLLEVVTPEAVFAQEVLRGQLLVQDSLPAQTPARIEIKAAGKVLWSEDFAATGKGERRVEFSIPVEQIPSPNGVSITDKTLRVLQVAVSLRGVAPNLERTRANNAQEVTLHVLNRKRRVLILDDRPRWETRYLHNHFDRDSRWSANLLLDDGNADPAQSPLQKGFPKTREALLDYDLVVLGDVAVNRLGQINAGLIQEWVEKHGGGLILVDGHRQNLAQWLKGPSAALIPVRWASTAPAKAPLRWKLAASANSQAALSLSTSSSANASLWSSLPPAMWCAGVEPRAGAQVLAFLQSEGATPPLPAVVFSQVGAGAVLYLGSDEAWRWRFQVADLHHQRLWMQLASWIASPPFQVEDATLSIGTDRLRYELGERGEIRVKLRDGRGNLRGDAQPLAHLMHEGRDVATLALEPDPTHFGVYRAQTPPLKAGDYQVAVAAAAGATRSPQTLSLHVAQGGNQEWANLTMNRPLLEAMAVQSGGRFLREEQAGELPLILQALDRREVQVRETILWSSWWWFGAIMLLLATEWLLRRRLRLI